MQRAGPNSGKGFHSKPQEDFPLVQEPGEPEQEQHGREREKGFAGGTKAGLDRPAREAFGHLPEVQDLGREVDCQRIGADPHKRLAPPPPAPDVHHLMEHPHLLTIRFPFRNSPMIV